MRKVILQHWFYWWLLLLGVWLLIGLEFGIQTLPYHVAKRQVQWGHVLPSELLLWGLWAVLTPFIVALARYYPIDRRRLIRSLLVHVIAGMFISFAHIVSYALISRIFVPSFQNPVTRAGGLLPFLFTGHFHLGVFVYWVILTISLAFQYYSKHRLGELRASQLELQSAHLESRLAQAQLQALRMQLHPHFLFNTLNSISALLRKDPDAADEMIGCLGDFLRLTLENSGKQEVKLQEELEFLNRYLEIERIRFQSRLLTQMQIEPQTLAALVPNLVLQPIVENAIRHGIAPNENQGRIEVRASRTDGKLLLEVQDNGPGLPARGDNNLITVNEGIGFRNTKARLQQLYGAAHRFAVDSVPDGGLRVTIEIPYTTSVAAAERNEEQFAQTGAEKS